MKLYNFLRLIPDLLELFQNYSGAHDNLVQIKFLTPLQVSLSLLPFFLPSPLPFFLLPSFASIFTTLLLLSFICVYLPFLPLPCCSFLPPPFSLSPFLSSRERSFGANWDILPLPQEYIESKRNNNVIINGLGLEIWTKYQ